MTPEFFDYSALSIGIRPTSSDGFSVPVRSAVL